MSSRKHSTIQSAPRLVYTSPCGLLIVERHAPADYSYSIEGQVKGYERTADAAEAAGHALLCELLEATVVETSNMEAEATTVIINEPGLYYTTITITATSTVELATRDSGVNLYYALLIDGYYHDLVMWKHTRGRPERMEAMQRAVATVEAAITSLREPVATLAAPSPRPRSIEWDRTKNDYVMTLDGKVVGWARSYSEAEKILDEREAALPPLDICPVCHQVRDDLGRCGCDYRPILAPALTTALHACGLTVEPVQMNGVTVQMVAIGDDEDVPEDDGLGCAACGCFPCLCCRWCGTTPCVCRSVPEDDGVRADVTAERLGISDFASVLLRNDLATRGLRLASGDESGWCYRLPGSATVWVTDTVVA